VLPLDKRPATPGRPVNSTVEALVARRRVKIRSKPTPLLRERFAPALHTTTTARSAAVPPPTRRPAAADPPPTRRRRPAATPRPPSSRDTLGPQCRQRRPALRARPQKTPPHRPHGPHRACPTPAQAHTAKARRAARGGSELSRAHHQSSAASSSAAVQAGQPSASPFWSQWTKKPMLVRVGLGVRGWGQGKG
jgi:hypothetical protein